MPRTKNWFEFCHSRMRRLNNIAECAFRILIDWWVRAYRRRLRGSDPWRAGVLLKISSCDGPWNILIYFFKRHSRTADVPLAPPKEAIQKRHNTCSGCGRIFLVFFSWPRCCCSNPPRPSAVDHIQKKDIMLAENIFTRWRLIRRLQGIGRNVGWNVGQMSGVSRLRN